MLVAHEKGHNTYSTLIADLLRGTLHLDGSQVDPYEYGTCYQGGSRLLDLTLPADLAARIKLSRWTAGELIAIRFGKWMFGQWEPRHEALAGIFVHPAAKWQGMDPPVMAAHNRRHSRWLRRAAQLRLLGPQLNVHGELVTLEPAWDTHADCRRAEKHMGKCIKAAQDIWQLIPVKPRQIIYNPNRGLVQVPHTPELDLLDESARVAQAMADIDRELADEARLNAMVWKQQRVQRLERTSARITADEEMLAAEQRWKRA